MFPASLPVTLLRDTLFWMSARKCGKKEMRIKVRHVILSRVSRRKSVRKKGDRG